MKRPTLSIITVNFNNKEGLEKTIQSLGTQTYTDYEHIIIDAGSNDGSTEYIIAYAENNNHLSYWVSEPDNGIYDGMNKGLKQAKGEYLYFLNSGDSLLSDVLVNIPFDGTQYIYGDVMLGESKENDKCRQVTPPDSPSFYFFTYDSLPHQSSFIHRSLFTNKLYDTRYKIISDWAHSFQSIIMENCSYKHISYVIARCDGGGVSSDYATAQAERDKWFQENLSGQMHSVLIDMKEYHKSKLKSIIPEINKTRKFHKRVCKLIFFLYKVNKFFSTHKTKK